MPGLAVTDNFFERELSAWQYGYCPEKRASVQFRGVLQLVGSGHLVLSVPASLIRGLYESLAVPGLSLPQAKDGGGIRSGIVVMTPAELETIGGASKVIERGKTFNFSFGDFFVLPAKNWPGVSTCWHWHVKSPELRELRKSYGLPPKLEDLYDFSVIVAYRKVGVMGLNAVSKVV